MKFNFLTLLLFFIQTGILFAQSDFRPGYIITNEYDTLFGEIDYRGDLLMSNYCKFRIKENAIENKYLPEDIFAYRFIDSKYYISREVNGKKTFLEFLIKGEINIYFYKDPANETYYLEKDVGDLVEIPYKETMIYKEYKRLRFESRKHIGILNYYMQDTPKLRPRINRITKPEHRSLINLAADYHDIVCEGDACIIYEKKQPLFSVSLGPFGGITHFKSTEDLIVKNYFQPGILLRLWMPLKNEKLFFKTGVLQTKLEFERGNTTYYKIPAHIEYIYPKRKFRPTISYGLNFYYPANRSTSFTGGVNYLLNQKVWLNLSLESEFNSFVLLLPGSFIAYSIQTGVYFKF